MPSILRNEEHLRKVMSECNSIKECLLKLGLRAAGGNYKSLIKACNDFGIVIKRCDGKVKTKVAVGLNTKTLEEILVENSTYTNRCGIKKKLLKAGLLEEKCNNCGIGPLWNNKPLTLQLEHVNGVYNDHRLENLCLLCPNCHTQTSTFAGKHHKAGDKRNTMHNHPRNRKSIKRVVKFKAQWPAYDDLLLEIQRTNKSTVAKRLGVSWTAVDQHVKKYAPK